MTITRRKFLIGTGTTVGAAMVAPIPVFAEEHSILVPHDKKVITPALNGDIHEKIKKQFADVMESLRYEVNDDFTRRNVVLKTSYFLREYQQNRELYEWRVICDETNNTPSLIDSHGLRAEIFYKPTRSIQYYYIIGAAC